MLCYRVLLEGAGGLMEERESPSGKSLLRPMGFYTTRFVTAGNEDAARASAIASALREAAHLTQPGHPWRIHVVTIELVESTVERGEGRGFTFFADEESVH